MVMNRNAEPSQLALVMNLPANAGSLPGSGRSTKKGMTTHPSILA